MAKLLALLLLTGASQLALAQSCSVSNPAAVTVVFPATINVPRDAPVGTMLSGWVAANSQENWSCSYPRYYGNISWLDLAAATGDRINSGGISYALIKTNVDGVGIIAKFSETSTTTSTAGATSPTVTAQINVGSQNFYNNQSQNGIGQVNNSISIYTSTKRRTVSLALIRSGMQSLGGKRMSGALVARSNVRFQPFSPGATVLNPDPSRPLQYIHEINYTAVNFVESTCQTPDVTFNMGTVPLSTFQGTGTRNGNWKMQNLNINNCPANLSRISLILPTPATGWLDSANKVFNLTSATDPATAKGIGIQLAVGTNQTVPAYDTPILLNSYGYNSSTGGSFTVPLSARYVKPASSTTVSGGRANGALVFLMTYQ